MAHVSISPVAPGEDSYAGGGSAALSVTFWLGLAATPTFAIMALGTVFSSAQPDLLCITMQSSSAVSGMTLMYLLMSAFHLGPWLKLISD